MLIGTERGSYSRPSIVASGMTSWRLRAAEHDGGPQWFPVIHPECINDGAAMPDSLSDWAGCLSSLCRPLQCLIFIGYSFMNEHIDIAILRRSVASAGRSEEHTSELQSLMP